MVEGKEPVETAAPSLGLQRAPDGMRVAERDLSRRGTAASSVRTKSSNVGKEACLDRRRESSRKIADAGVADGDEGLGTTGPRRGSKRTPGSMFVVRKASGEKTE